MNIVKQILIIVLASAIVMALFMPLAQTDLADGMRSGFGAESESMRSEGGDGPGEMPAGIGFVAGFIKEIVVMGIPMLITLGILRIVRGKSRSRQPKTI